MSSFKGICYSAFPTDYDPGTANNTCAYQGSDIAAKYKTKEAEHA